MSSFNAHAPIVSWSWKRDLSANLFHMVKLLCWFVPIELETTFMSEWIELPAGGEFCLLLATWWFSDAMSLTLSIVSHFVLINLQVLRL